MREMPKWGWKHSAMFIASVLCATSALVAAGLADASTDPAAATVQALPRR